MINKFLMRLFLMITHRTLLGVADALEEMVSESAEPDAALAGSLSHLKATVGLIAGLRRTKTFNG